MKTIKELENEREKLLLELDGYGYSREETLKDLYKGFETETEEETCFKWRDMNLKIQTLKDVLKLIDEIKIIHEAHYGEDDGTDEIKLIKYLIDKEELKSKIQGKEEKWKV